MRPGAHRCKAASRAARSPAPRLHRRESSLPCCFGESLAAWSSLPTEGCPLHLWDDTYAEGRWVSERRRRRKSRRKFPAQKAKISHFLTNSSSQDEISAAFDPPSRRMWWILRRSRAAAFLQFVAESGHRIQACASVQAPRGRGHSRVQHEAGEHLCAFLAVHQPPGHVHQVRFHLS